MTEQWRSVVGYEDIYEVSDRGRVRTIARMTERLGRPYPIKARLRAITTCKARGYQTVPLTDAEGHPRRRYVHRLVLEAFTGPCPQGMEACHNDGDPGNNAIGNLRWDTHASNIADVIAHGNHRKVNQSHCIRGHLLMAPNLVDRSEGRGCRSCAAAHAYVQRTPGADLATHADRYYSRYTPERSA
jgi:hypothetical protein